MDQNQLTQKAKMYVCVIGLLFSRHGLAGKLKRSFQEDDHLMIEIELNDRTATQKAIDLSEILPKHLHNTQVKASEVNPGRVRYQFGPLPAQEQAIDLLEQVFS